MNLSPAVSDFCLRVDHLLPRPALITIVDDDILVRRSLTRLLKAVGFKGEAFASAEDFLTEGNRHKTRCLILDVRLPGMSSLDLQRQLEEASLSDVRLALQSPNEPAYEPVSQTVRGEDMSAHSLYRHDGREAGYFKETLRSGQQFPTQNSAAAMAFPTSKSVVPIRRAAAAIAPQPDGQEVKEAPTSGEMIGQSPGLRLVLEQIERVAPTEATVLILGESGTGKELVAAAIHERSARCHRPLVRVNCAAVPAELFESEFFGHVKGAFTGALRDRVGRFQHADGGTLFLDEVGEIPLAQQGKLLRVLQDGQFERVGEDRTRAVDVRVVAATNRDLRREVEAGRFRADLYYRLSVFPVGVPPLRERKEDIPLLATHFVQLFCTRLHRDDVNLTSDDIRLLNQYDWPGNVRELQHVLERALIHARGPRLRVDLALTQGAAPSSYPLVLSRETQEVAPPPRVLPHADLKRREQENILAALEQARWKVYGAGGAAELLGLHPTTLASRMKALGLRRAD